MEELVVHEALGLQGRFSVRHVQEKCLEQGVRVGEYRINQVLFRLRKNGDLKRVKDERGYLWWEWVND